MKKGTTLKPLVYLQASNFFSGVSNAVVMIMIPWLTLEVTSSPAFAGLVVALSSIPSLVVAPFGGILIKRFGSKGISVFADLMSMLSVLAFPILGLLGQLNASTILFFALVGAIFDPLGYTARKTMIQPVSESANFEVNRLNGIHEGLLGSSWIVGPALGAWLIALIGPANSFYVVSSLFFVAACTVLLIPSLVLKKTSKGIAHEISSNFSQLTLGFRRIWADRFMRALLISVLIIAAIYLPTEAVILPTYFEDLGKPVDLGIVISVLAAGSTITAFAYGWILKHISERNLIRTAFIGASLGTIGMSVLPPFWLMLLFALILGLAWGPFSPYLTSKIQSRYATDEHPMIFSAQTALFYAAPPVGMIVVGLALEAFGTSLTYLGLALIMLFVSLVALISKPIRTEK